MSILSNVQQLGQQIWLDNLSRSLVQSGELAQLSQQGIAGVTSNPAIFQKAFEQDGDYLHAIAELKSRQLSAKTIYETLAIADVQAACDVFRPLFESSQGTSGLVSLEVSPDLSHDTEGTIQEARRLYHAIQRPNVMIKIPATDAGIAAMETLLADGININLTLLFSRQQTQKAFQSYIKALSHAHTSTSYPVQMVASFFISRIDNALDAQLPEHLQGKTAIALAQAAYHDWYTLFHSAEFAPLATQGVHKPRLLWASTGVKNPNYPDTLYLDQLIGANTINTVPQATLTAFLHHGTARTTLTQHADAAHAILQAVQTHGIDLEQLAQQLQSDGLTQFEHAFAQLLAPLS